MPKPYFFYATGTSYVLGMFERKSPAGWLSSHRDEIAAIAASGSSGVAPIGGGSQVIPGLNGTSAVWSGSVANDPFPTMLDPNKWVAKKISYPAAAFPMLDSINAGVANTVQAIRNLPTGTPFCLGGYSQGAAVMSLVLTNYLQTTSSISARYTAGDFKGAVMFGNPCRQMDKLWPAFKTYAGGSFSGSWDVVGSTTGGAGCFPSSYRITNTPASWYEFVGGRDYPIDIINCVGGSPDGGYLRDAAGDLLSLSFLALVPFLLSTDKFNAVNKMLKFGAGGHVSYPIQPPPGYPAGSATSYQIALDYLDSIADGLDTAQAVLPSTGAIGWSPTVKPVTKKSLIRK